MFLNFIAKIRNFLYKNFEYLYLCWKWITHRTFDKYNIIKIKSLTPDYYDKDTIMLHGMFQLLTDYVERELSWMEYICVNNTPKPNKNNRKILGLKYLDWEISLGDASLQQCASAKEIKELYIWWTETRNLRKDDVSKNYNEDTEMMIRLAKIREYLWS